MKDRNHSAKMRDFCYGFSETAAPQGCCSPLRYRTDNLCITFTGKELDEETGYGYFGARYMDHELTTGWLSVDPMTDKYPSISPYSYCAWNPVKLVDPDGEEVYLKGEKGCVDKALSMMNSASKHLTFFIGADGRVSCTGKARNRRERMMINIINSQDVTVNMEVQDHDRISGSDDIINEGGGAYMGNTLNADKSHANTRQIVNVDKLEFYDKATNKNGNLIWHEIGESFIEGFFYWLWYGKEGFPYG